MQVSLINSVSTVGNDFVIAADYVQMLTGKAALKAAKKAGDAEYDLTAKGDTTWYVPNDYYVVNDNSKIRNLAVAPTAVIMLVKEGTSRLSKSTVGALKKSYRDKLYRLTIVNDKVVKIEEIYVP